MKKMASLQSSGTSSVIKQTRRRAISVDRTQPCSKLTKKASCVEMFHEMRHFPVWGEIWALWGFSPLFIFSCHIKILTACGRRRSASVSVTGFCIWLFCISDTPGRPFLCPKHTNNTLEKKCQQQTAVITSPAANCCVTPNVVRLKPPLMRIVPSSWSPLKERRSHCGAGPLFTWRVYLERECMKWLFWLAVPLS